MKIYARTLIASLTIALLLGACGGGASQPANVSVNSSPTPVGTPAAEEKPTATATPAPLTMKTDAPVEYAYLGITPGKDGFTYKIKVNTQKPISQVDISAKYTDASGKTLEETTIAWQNIVKSARQPIEPGKIYEAEGFLPEGATKVESELRRVIFADGSRWEAR